MRATTSVLIESCHEQVHFSSYNITHVMFRNKISVLNSPRSCDTMELFAFSMFTVNKAGALA